MDPLKNKTAMAIAAHPDDIEFVMAGTLLALKKRDWEIHYLNLSRGNLGSATLDSEAAARVREREAREAARLLGAHWHAPFLNDLEIVYDVQSMRRLAAVIREVHPSVVLTHAPADYMEDHMNASRLAVSAAFTREMPNFETIPPRSAVRGEVTVYHAQPHMNRDPLGQTVVPGICVDVTEFMETKRAALSAHHSQKEWLDATQGMDSYVKTMEDLNREVGRMSRRFEFAEGWRKHLHAGFCAPGRDPLMETLHDQAADLASEDDGPDWPTVIPYP